MRRAELQDVRVDELPGQTRWRPPGAVGRIARDRVANRGEVDAELVGASGQQQRLDERPVAEALADREASLRRAAAGTDGHALAMAWVAPDRRIDQPFVLADVAADEQQVVLLSCAALHLTLEVGRGGRGAPDHYQPRGIAVQAVDDAGSQVTRL